jgi:hypothetical protein
VQQQTGVPPNQTQHMQPASMQAIMQSQQAWTMSQQALSPLVQVMQTPSAVISQVQLHMAMLHWHMHMPFFMHMQLHMPSHSILQRFCRVAQPTSSSHEQYIFIPPAHFSIRIVQRGTISMLPALGIMVVIPMPGIVAPMGFIVAGPIVIGRSVI